MQFNDVFMTNHFGIQFNVISKEFDFDIVTLE